MSSNGGSTGSEMYNAASTTKSQLANEELAVEAHQPSTLVYQGGYPLDSMSTTTDDLLQKSQYSHFEHSGISETHLVQQQPDVKKYNL